jgi:methionyl-tRNA formyltransferase
MTKTSLRVIFAGTPEFSAAHLQRLIESKYQLVGVFTQPDRPAGRGRRLQPSPVKQVAEQAGLSIFQPASLKDEAVQLQIAALAADVMVVVAYGLILPQAVLDTPRLGCLNVHASLLPRWRGAAPIQRAIEAGDTTTGITLMQMDAGLDTGAMLGTISCLIDGRTNAADLHDELKELGPLLLLEVLDDIDVRQRNARAQDDGQANYARKLLKTEAQITWGHGAKALDRKIRAFNPSPVCYSILEGKRIRVWQARPLPSESSSETPGTIVRTSDEGIFVRCAEGDLCLEVLQLEGGKALTAEQLLRAHQALFAVGGRFESAISIEHK